MELLTVKNDSLAKVPDNIAPITVPTGRLVSSSNVSSGKAAIAAKYEASEQKDIIGILGDAQQVKNLIFLGVVVFVVFKVYKRGAII